MIQVVILIFLICGVYAAPTASSGKQILVDDNGFIMWNYNSFVFLIITVLSLY